MRTPLLAVQGLSVTLPGRDGLRQVVTDVSFSVEAGQVLGVVGESGSGKTLSLLALLRLLPPGGYAHAQRALFDGRELLDLPTQAVSALRGRDIAVVFQDPLAALNPVLSIGAQLGNVLRQHFSLTRAQRLARSRELLVKVGIEDPVLRLRQYPHELSGGMRQRVMLALALAGEPRLLIADEPTTALDVTLQASLVSLIQHLQRESGLTVIWVTHDLALLARIADRIVVLKAGVAVEEASALQLFTAPVHPYTRSLLRAAGVTE